MPRSRFLALTVAFVALTACGDSPTAPRAFDGGAVDGTPVELVAPLGTLAMIAPLSGFGSGAVSAINNRHETAGWSYTTGTASHAFFRTSTGTLVDLGNLGGGSVALGLNDSSAVVGYSYLASGSYHAFVSKVVNGTRTMVDLGTANGGDRSLAYAINTAGTVVGYIYTGDGKQHAARWVPPMYVGQDLGVMSGGTRSVAYAINDAGTIVGYASNASGRSRAFKWTAAAGMTDVGTIGGTESIARAINANGDIVGSSTNAAGVYHAFKKTAGASTLTDLGSPGGPSYGYGISATGQVIGWAQPSVGAEQACLWAANGTWSDLGTSGSATQAQTYAINDMNEAVGSSGGQASIWYIGNHTPVASFLSKSHSKVNQTPEDFDASASSDADGDALTYSWDFDDSGSATNTATGVTASHLYTVKGVYNVSVTVTDSHGFSNTKTLAIRIN